MGELLTAGERFEEDYEVAPVAGAEPERLKETIEIWVAVAAAVVAGHDVRQRAERTVVHVGGGTRDVAEAWGPERTAVRVGACHLEAAAIERQACPAHAGVVETSVREKRAVVADVAACLAAKQAKAA